MANDEVPWSTVGYLVAKRTYARRKDNTDPDSPTEEWSDIVDRVLNASQNQLGVGFTDNELERLRTYMTKLKGTVAGRFLWQLGTHTVNKFGLMSLMNCAFTTVDDPVRPFTWAYDSLMLGSGVGYNVQREYVYKLPPVREDFKRATRQDNASADFIVPDSREGWVALLDRLLRSAFYEDVACGFTFSTQLVRGKGAPIKGFGGVASGPEEMCRGIDLIGELLEGRAGKQLRPIDCLDVMNILGMIVISGNVRRSAQIAIGDCDDLQYLKAKDWSSGNIPNWRAYSNNSVVCNDFSMLPEAFWDTYAGNSEPYGLINLKLSQSCGRLGEKQYKDKGVRGFNPCAEQSLAPYETCCLAEIFLPNIESKEELLDVATLLYRINKHSLALPCHHKETERIVHKNMRMGIGLTGILQCPEKLEWAAWVYPKLREFDKEYSKQHGWPPSIKIATIKPSGTLSLLPGVTPGIHPAFAHHMIRRIRIAANHPLVDTCRSHGYHIEYQKNFDGSLDFNTVVVEFPFSHPKGTPLAEEMTAIDQLEWVRKGQTLWSDNAVSCTVYYTKEELPAIREYLAENYNTSFKSLSFLLRQDHGFVQAPLEEIPEERYNEIVANTKIISSIDDADFESQDECSSGVCPIR
jgi:ribonucleoside-triphosphate reductase (thioredoxin)